MKKILLVLIINLLFSSLALAEDTVENYSVGDAFSVEKIKAKLGTDISFYFGNQQHGKVIKNYGTFRTNRRTNAYNKTAKEACQWVFLSTMKALKDRAIREGGNAVIDIKSNYKNNLVSSYDSFQCGIGALNAGVALVGTVVEIEK